MATFLKESELIREENEVQPEQIGMELVRKRKCPMVENPDISPR